MHPLIGISTNFLTVEKGKFIGMERIYVNKDYSDAVLQAGGIPLLLPPVEDTESIRRYTQVCDGFILSGGGDINPCLFGESPQPGLEEFHTPLDHAQWNLTREILNTRKPLLAICRGMQLLNVVTGGTLWQDLSLTGQPVLLHSQYSPRGDQFHAVNITANSLTGRLLGTEIYVNSFHHQAIKKLGQGLSITATAPDGIIEAIELTDRPFGLGLQWHPEMLLTSSGTMLPLFHCLIENAKK